MNIVYISENNISNRKTLMSHHKNHAGTFSNRATASHESDYKDKYSDNDQKGGWRKVAWIQEM